MTDPKPLTRDELAEFLPSQRAIRAFEKLFDKVPTEVDDVLIIAESALLLANSLKSANSNLQSKIFELEVELQKRDSVPTSVLNKLLELEQRIDLLKRPNNLDQILRRIEILEILEG